jgi:hypothetical protein
VFWRIINSELLVKSVSLWSEALLITLRKIEPMLNNEKAQRGGSAVRRKAERDGDSSYGEVQSEEIKGAEGNERYRVEISNRFAALENLDTEVDVIKAWETIRENIKISA